VHFLHTGGSPFFGLLACLPIMAQSVAPQKSTSPPSNSACLLGSDSSAIVRLYGPEHPTQSANAFVECRRTQTPVIQTQSTQALPQGRWRNAVVLPDPSVPCASEAGSK
jgi:hypothetical protein